MTIRLRLTLWYTGILFLILVIFSLLMYLGLSRSLFLALDNHLQREAAQVIGEIRFDSPDEAEEAEETEENARETYEREIGATKVRLNYTPEEGVLWRVLTATGQPLFDPGYFEGTPLDPALLQTRRVRLDNITLADGTPLRLYTAPFVLEQQGAGIIQVGESYKAIQEVQQQLIFLLAISLPVTLLFTSAGGWFLAGRALAPIDRITRSAQQISADELHQRLKLDLPNDEIGRLAATFDQMLARLDEAFERQKRFIADASHELRTPLTVLKGDVEVALNRPRTAEEYREALQLVNQTTDRLAGLVEELFLLARADNRQFPLVAEPFDLIELLNEVSSLLFSRALAKNITLQLDTPEQLLLPADRDKLSRLFMNLIDNAIKYSNPGDAVTITAGLDQGQVRVTVSDTGPGIATEHLPHLFERFYRIDKARARNATGDNGSSGAGLGLSIAQWLAQLHGGHIEVTSQVGQGTTFTVWLPLQPPATPGG